MLNRREYEIAFVGLKEGQHEFDYQVKEEFFIERGMHDFTSLDAQIKLILDKHVGFLQLKFEVGGKVETTCDRCGDPLEIELWDDFNIVIKMVENPDEMNENEEDPDIFYISRGESHIHVSQWLYDFVLLSIPMQRMCKDKEDGTSGCNPEVIQKLEEMEKRSRETNSNSIWKDLDKFKES
jgi:uncharacterized metal-binding protein YceD (DUF177 family)